MSESTAETDASRSRSRFAFAAWTALAALAIAATALLFYWLWSLTDRLDANAGHRGLTNQLMRRKTSAMLAIRDGLAAGELDRAEQGAAVLRQVSEISSWYLPDRRYAALSEDFREALAAFDGALNDRDLAELRAAHDRLAESCLECHRMSGGNRIEPESIRLFTPQEPSGPTEPQTN
jgi:hypothetical protein